MAGWGRPCKTDMGLCSTGNGRPMRKHAQSPGEHPRRKRRRTFDFSVEIESLIPGRREADAPHLAIPDSRQIYV